MYASLQAAGVNSISICMKKCKLPDTEKLLCGAGAMAACVAPLFSQRPDIHQWLHHYTQLGVNKFHMYVPTLHSHEPHHHEAPHEVRGHQ